MAMGGSLSPNSLRAVGWRASSERATTDIRGVGWRTSFSEVALMPDALQFAAVEKRPDHGARQALEPKIAIGAAGGEGSLVNSRCRGSVGVDDSSA